MATTIDKLDLSVYNMYAMRTRMIEQYNQELRPEQAASIPPQTQIVNTYVQLSELDLLLGIAPILTPWAYFFPPKQFRTLRRPLFSSSKVAPSLKIIDEEAEEYKALNSVMCETDEEKGEKEALANCFQVINKLNNWMGFIIGRIGQFLQG